MQSAWLTLYTSIMLRMGFAINRTQNKITIPFATRQWQLITTQWQNITDTWN